MKLLNVPIDISTDFRDFSNTYYLADSLAAFDPVTGEGKLVYKRYQYFTRQAFDNMLGVLRPVPANEFPATEYEASPELPFSVQFVSARTVRVRAASGFQVAPDEASLMLVDGKAPVDHADWKYSKIDSGYRYTSPYGSVTILIHPWHVEFRDAAGRLLTRTIHHADNVDSTATHPYSRSPTYAGRRIIRGVCRRHFLCLPVKKSLGAESRLRGLTNGDKRWCCGQTMRTACRMKPCTSPSHSL